MTAPNRGRSGGPYLPPAFQGYGSGGMVKPMPGYAGGGYVGRQYHMPPTSMAAPNVTVQGGGGGMDATQFGREIRAALNGAQVVMDGRAVGNLLIRQADRQSREAR